MEGWKEVCDVQRWFAGQILKRSAPVHRIRGFGPLNEAALADMSTFIEKARVVPQGDREILFDKVSKQGGKYPALLTGLKATFKGERITSGR